MNLPKQMMEASRWLVWKRIPEPGKKDRKVPYYANGTARGKEDSPEDLASLCTYAEAKRAVAKGGYAGLGFALGPDGTGNCWQGIDLDQLSKRDNLADLLLTLPGYTEVSPSGDGYHAIGYGRPFPTLGSNESGIEAYAGRRYFTVTGKDGAGELGDLAEYVETVLAPIHRPKAKAASASDDLDDPFTTEDQLRDLRAALVYLDPDSYDLWIAAGQALRPAGEDGLEIWLEWSARSDKFDEEVALRKWDGFTGERTGYAAIFAKAQKAGWMNPKKGKAPESKPVPTEKFTGDIDALFADVTLRDEDVQKMADAEFLIPDMIVRGHVAAYVSPGNGGKTTIFIHLCERLAAMGLRVMYINVDGSPGDLKRHHAHAKTHGYQVLAPDAKDGKSTGDVLAKLRAIAEGGMPCNDVVFILDTLKKFVDVIDKRQAKELYKLFRSLTVKGATVCLLGHTNKHAGEDGKQVFEGTADLRNDVDELIYLDSFKNEATNCLEVTTRPDKIRAEFSPKSFIIDLEDRSVTEPEKVIKTLAKDAREVLEHIKQAIHNGNHSQKEIIAWVEDRTEYKVKKIRAVLKANCQGDFPEITEKETGRGRDLHYSLNVPFEGLAIAA